MVVETGFSADPPINPDAQPTRAQVWQELTDDYAEHFTDRVNSIGYRYPNKVGHGPVDAEDVVQDAYLKALTARNYTPGPGIGRWVGTIAKNTALDVDRRKGTETIGDESIEYQMHRKDVLAQPVPQSDIDDMAAAEAMRSALYEHCKEESVDAFLLNTFDGLTFEELTVLMGVPMGTVKSRMKRVKDRAKNFVGLDGTDEVPEHWKRPSKRDAA